MSSTSASPQEELSVAIVLIEDDLDLGVNGLIVSLTQHPDKREIRLRMNS